MRKITRRSLLKTAGMGAVSMITHQSAAGSTLTAPGSKVYSCFDDSLVSENTVSESNVRNAYTELIKNMTGKSSESAAWTTIFPGAGPSSQLCIKLNCLHVQDSTPNHPRWESLKALIGSLTTVFSAENITLIDNDLWKSGKSKVQLAYGDTNLNSSGVKFPVDSYDGTKTITIGGKTFYPSRALHSAQFGIGFHVGRSHCCYADNLSGCIKNFMGAVSGSTSTYKAQGGGEQKFHGTFTDFVDLFKNYMAAKIQLYISDNLFCCKDEREGFSKVTKRITMSNDPCALDSWMVDFLNGVGGLRTAKKGVPTALAAAGLGSTTYTQIDVPLISAPQPPSVADVQSAIKNHKSKSVPLADVQTTIDTYNRKIAQ